MVMMGELCCCEMAQLHIKKLECLSKSGKGIAFITPDCKNGFISFIKCKTLMKNDIFR
jgi:hypothetical protein